MKPDLEGVRFIYAHLFTTCVLLALFSEIVDRTQVIETAQSLLALTYAHSVELLPVIIDEKLAHLSGGEDWKEGRQ